MKLPFVPSRVLDSNTVGLYEAQTDFDPEGYMAFNISIHLELVGINESSVYHDCATSEKLVAIRFRFVDGGITDRWIINRTMATSNVTVPQVENDTYTEWTEQLTHVSVERRVENFQLGDNTFEFAIEFEIEFAEEPEAAHEEIEFGCVVHLDGTASPSGPEYPGGSTSPGDQAFPWSVVLAVAGVGLIVVMGVAVLRMRTKKSS